MTEDSSVYLLNGLIDRCNVISEDTDNFARWHRSIAPDLEDVSVLMGVAIRILADCKAKLRSE